VLFEDPKITRVIEIMGGWIEVCAWPTADIKFRRKEFLDAYKALPSSGEPKPLAGICERDNCARGYIGHAPKPVLIESGRLQIEAEKPEAIPPPSNLLSEAGFSLDVN
jgi:hypothetical protein